MMHAPHIVLFELYAGGHRGQYVRQLVEFWNAHALPGRLTVQAPTAFFEQHQDVARAAAQNPSRSVTCAPITEPFTTRGPINSARAHARLLRRCVLGLRPQHVVCMYFDQVQLPLALGLRFDDPVAISGIYFRPTFHYSPSNTRPARDRATRYRKRLLLQCALRNRHVSTLFCLDPHVVAHVPSDLARLVPLPDGVRVDPPLDAPETVRDRWGVDSSRRIALFFGSIEKRKGISQTLDALPLLPESCQRRLALVIVGRGSVQLSGPLQRLRRSTKVHIEHDERFVDEEEIAAIFGASNLILVPYQRHVGSSGVLVRAAQAEVPVLGSDYGLVGRHIQTETLGLAVDSTRPQAIAQGLMRWLEQDRFPFDRGRAAAFGAANTAEQFGRAVFGALLPDFSFGPDSHPGA